MPPATIARSTSVTSWPALTSASKAVAPTMPPPTTTTVLRMAHHQARRQQRVQDLAGAHGRVGQQRRGQAVQVLAGALDVDAGGDLGDGLDAVVAPEPHAPALVAQ